MICAFNPKLNCEVVQALARGSREADKVCEGVLILERREDDIIDSVKERLN